MDAYRQSVGADAPIDDNATRLVWEGPLHQPPEAPDQRVRVIYTVEQKGNRLVGGNKVEVMLHRDLLGAACWIDVPSAYYCHAMLALAAAFRPGAT